MTFDFNKINESKREMRARLAALPFGEKLRLLDQLRERTVALRGNRLSRKGKSRATAAATFSSTKRGPTHDK